MHLPNSYKTELSDNGFAVTARIFTDYEIAAIIDCIDRANTSNDTFRKSNGLFAIRQFLKEVPGVQPLIFNEPLRCMIDEIGGKNCCPVKSIFFDKPPSSNWYVAYHQDLTISVKNKIETPGFGPWTVKHQQFAAQPPLYILENIFTVRIHLDETNEDNGALRIVPKSHIKGICRPENIDWTKESEVTCSVPKGGVMLMKPLLLHSSGRTVNHKRRRVIHIEFTSAELPGGLEWSEKLA